jgi:sugar-specific transcriptional regulator TrmB
MSEIAIAKELLEYGLTDPESRIYLYLAKKGASPAGEVARALKIRRGQTYNVLKVLQKRGIVETTAGKPTRFSGLPLPKALNVLVETQRQRQVLMEKLRPELLSMWESVLSTKTEETKEEKFQFLKGVESIYRKASELVDSSVSQITMVAPELALYHADRFGVIERMNNASRKNITVRVLAELTSRIKEIAMNMKEINTRSLMDHSPPHFLIVDEREIVFLTNPIESVDPREANAVWTNSPMLVRTMQHLFEDMWASERLESRILTSEPDKRKTPTEEKEQTIENLQREFTRYLTASGFEVKKNYTVVGDSGAEHVFALALFRNNGKPVVIDFELSDEPISSMRVIAFFVKKSDVENLVADARLVVRPGLDRKAQEIVTFYRIKSTELS